jgi:hypothetical protein
MTSLTSQTPPSHPTEEEDEGEELETGPFFEYLQSPQGHEVSTRLVTILEDIKKAALSHRSDIAKRETWLQALVFLIVVAAAVTLAILDKFSNQSASFWVHWSGTYSAGSRDER